MATARRGWRRAPPADQPELPESPREGRLTPEAAERALVRKPQIGDTRPAPPVAAPAVAEAGDGEQPRRKQTSRERGRRSGGERDRRRPR